MDYRLFAEEPPPPMPDFVDPGTPPPSFIFALDQNLPPYDTSVETFDPFDDCDAYHASLCAIQYSIRLVSKARDALCPSFAVGGAVREEALANVTAGLFTMTGTRGFGVYIVLENGTIAADSLHSELIGQRIDGVQNSGFVAQPHLIDYISWVTQNGGGFVPHYSVRISQTELDVHSGGTPLRATSYFESCATGERIGVTFAREPLDSAVPCDNNANGYCALQNVRRIVGQLAVDSLNAHSAEELSKIWYDVSYTEEYMVDGTEFVPQIAQLSWWGYPGADEYYNPSPLDNTPGTIVAIGGGMGFTMVGENGSTLNDPFAPPAEAGSVTMGEYSFARSNMAAWKGGAWQDIKTVMPWATYTRVALTFGFVFNGTGYSVASSVTHIPAANAVGPVCATCLTNVSWPCSITNAMRLASHTKLESLTPSGNWSYISSHPWFGSQWPSAQAAIASGAEEETWPGLSLRVFDFNNTCVASGYSEEDIGKDVTEILGSVALHLKIMQAATTGGGWVQQDLDDGSTMMLQVTKVIKENRFYYIAVPIRKAWGPWANDCSSSFAEPCSESNTQALVGMAAAELLTAENATHLTEVMVTIANRTGDFSEDSTGDFFTYILSLELECFEGLACRPDWPNYWLGLLEAAEDEEEGAWVEMSATGTFKDSWAYVFKARWHNPNSHEYLDFVLVSIVLDADRPPSCSSDSDCPDNAACADGVCECLGDGLTTYTKNASSCGTLPGSSLSCPWVAGQVCDGSSCTTCPAGYYCVSGTAFGCPRGYYCEAGSWTPTACPAGTMGTKSIGTASSVCQACPSGSYAESEGSTNCTSCAAGTAIDTEGAVSCSRCAVGTFQEHAGQTSCTSCGDGLTTLYRAAIGAGECVCPQETYQPIGSESCKSCPEGLDCPEANTTELAIRYRLADPSLAWPIPITLEGYMAKADNGIAAYKCKDVAWCPGGVPGTCATNRDATTVGCSRCLAEYYTLDDGTCSPCEDGVATILLVAAMLVGFIVLGIFARMVNREQINQANTVTTAVITLGLTVSAVQTLGIFSSLTVRWIDPVKSILKAMLLLSFDLKVLRVECAVGQNSVLNSILRQSLAPGAAVYIAAVVASKKLCFAPQLEFRNQAVNAVGAVFQLFFVSIFVSTLTPFICYKHPENLGYSMVGDPAVLCTQTGTHGELVVVSVHAVLIVIIPYLSMVFYATFRYRISMASSAASYQHLRRYRFLFFRYMPEAYWYGAVTLLRSVLICLVPVVFRDLPSLQILGLSILLLVFCTLQLNTKPWRGDAANYMDAGISLLMVLLLVCVAMTTDFRDSDTILGILAAVLFTLVFVGVLVVLGHSAVKHLIPSPYFSRFVCHHKADAAAQARFLQLLFIQRTKQTCFLDSDNLTNLEDLFDIVRSRCGELVVLLTSQTLRRPWCAGEITIAWQSHGRVTAIYHPSFMPPEEEVMEADAMGAYLSAADFQLVEYGITNDAISKAYRWFLHDLDSKVYIRSDLVGRTRFEQAVKDVLSISNSRSLGPLARFFVNRPKRKSSSSSGVMTTFSGSKLQLKKSASTCNLDTIASFKPGSLLVSSLPDSDEATAAAGVLVGRLQGAMLELVPEGMVILADLSPSQVDEAVMSIGTAHALIVILSEGSLGSLEQLQIICNAVGAGVTSIPVNTPNFRFPTPRFFSDLQGRMDPRVESRLQLFFKSISVSYTTFGSLQVIGVQAESILSRVPHKRTQRSTGSKTQENAPDKSFALLKESDFGTLSVTKHSTRTSETRSAALDDEVDHIFFALQC